MKKKKHKNKKKVVLELSPKATQKLAKIVLDLGTLDYKIAEDFLNSSNDIPKGVKDTLSAVVNEHKVATESRAKLLEECLKAEEEVFGCAGEQEGASFVE